MNKKDVDSCGRNAKCKNELLLTSERENRELLKAEPDKFPYLYPTLNDPNFNLKIAVKKEFVDSKYDGKIYDVKKHATLLNSVEYELMPQQAFVKNYMSFQTPYNSLLLFHGLGSGKTCSAIGVCEGMRDYYGQMGINKKIIIVATPNVQDNFRLQLFDTREDKLKMVNGRWSANGCIGNKIIKDVNPTNIKNLPREKVIELGTKLINAHYAFYGYTQFSNLIAEHAGKGPLAQRTYNLQRKFGDTMIVIDEVHNIRISEDNANKDIGKNLMFLVNAASNVRLLLLSATPMFNSYREIMWIVNLMNLNDRRGVVSISDIFDKAGKFKKVGDKPVGRDLFIQKVTGYVSYIRGENPYTFPFRIYPNLFAPAKTFMNISEYPKYQLNGKRIPDDKKIDKLSLYLTAPASYQELGYMYIINSIRSRPSDKKFGYTVLQNPINALNIVYPNEHLQSIVNITSDEDRLAAIEELIDPFNPVEEEAEDIIILTDAIDIDAADIARIEPHKSDIFDNEAATAAADISDVEDKDALNKDSRKRRRKLRIVEDSDNEDGAATDVAADAAIAAIAVEPDVTLDAALTSIKKHRRKLRIVEDEDEDEEESPNAQSPKKCPEGSVLNPQTKRCNKTRKLGVPSKKCPEGSELNPSTNRCNKTRKSKQVKLRDADAADVPAHIVEGEISLGGGNRNTDSTAFIHPRELTGLAGLRRTMLFDDTSTPSVKGNFRYRDGAERIFAREHIGNYSAKIKSICDQIYNADTKKVSEGIILIYSSFIDGGIIPMALALEEMGFSRYNNPDGKPTKSLFASPPTAVVNARTFKPITKTTPSASPARYTVISGDTRLSPSIIEDVKHITSDANKDGDIIKVVMITQAGSEGIDFKNIRQVHVFEPWYNMNRIEQIIGRAVRNFSHKALVFEKRNVQIFLYGTILSNTDEEAVDLYVYRLAESKAIDIGKITRLLKETAVDCVLNHEQSELSIKNMRKIDGNKDVTQVLSTNITLNNFMVGDIPNSSNCDYMEQCTFSCLPSAKSSKLPRGMINYDTYNETFAFTNIDKIVQRIKVLMNARFFYTKSDFIKNITTPVAYPLYQIYAAITHMINDNVEFVIDKYGRTGNLVNIGDYYLFQPTDLTYPNISIYERSTPVDYKHNMVKIVLRDKIHEERPVIAPTTPDGSALMHALFNNCSAAMCAAEPHAGAKSADVWYSNALAPLSELVSALGNTNLGNSDVGTTFFELVVEHAIDFLMMHDLITALNYLVTHNTGKTRDSPDMPMASCYTYDQFIRVVNAYIQSKIMISEGTQGILIFNGVMMENLNVIINREGEWSLGEQTDRRIFFKEINSRHNIKFNPERFAAPLGFIGFNTYNKNIPNPDKYMVFKTIDMSVSRNTGTRCDQAGRHKLMGQLNIIAQSSNITAAIELPSNSVADLCIKQEMLLRYLNKIKRNGKTWFIDTSTEILYENRKRQLK
jgi:hypothetical protein